MEITLGVFLGIVALICFLGGINFASGFLFAYAAFNALTLGK